MGFKDLMEKTMKDIEYWAWYISTNSNIQKDDAKQEFLILIWRLCCKRKEVKVSYIQKRLKYHSHLILKNYYRKTESFEDLYDPFVLAVMYIPDIRFDVLDSMFKKELIGEFLRRLSDYNDKAYTVATCILKNQTRKEIAKKMKLEENTISIIFTRKILPILKEVYNEYSY